MSPPSSPALSLFPLWVQRDAVQPPLTVIFISRADLLEWMLREAFSEQGTQRRWINVLSHIGPALSGGRAARRDRWGIKCYIFQPGLRKPSSGVDRSRCCRLNIKPVKWNVLHKETLTEGLKYCTGRHWLCITQLSWAHAHLWASAWHVTRAESRARERGCFDFTSVMQVQWIGLVCQSIMEWGPSRNGIRGPFETT